MYILFIVLYTFSYTFHTSKIIGAVCPAMDLPEIKASSEKCCIVAILRSIALKKLFCTVN